jgi:hypothetical protein
MKEDHIQSSWICLRTSCRIRTTQRPNDHEQSQVGTGGQSTAIQTQSHVQCRMDLQNPPCSWPKSSWRGAFAPTVGTAGDERWVMEVVSVCMAAVRPSHSYDRPVSRHLERLWVRCKRRAEVATRKRDKTREARDERHERGDGRRETGDQRRETRDERQRGHEENESRAVGCISHMHARTPMYSLHAVFVIMSV